MRSSTTTTSASTCSRCSPASTVTLSVSGSAPGKPVAAAACGRRVGARSRTRRTPAARNASRSDHWSCPPATVSVPGCWAERGAQRQLVAALAAHGRRQLDHAGVALGHAQHVGVELAQLGKRGPGVFEIGLDARPLGGDLPPGRRRRHQRGLAAGGLVGGRVGARFGGGQQGRRLVECDLGRSLVGQQRGARRVGRRLLGGQTVAVGLHHGAPLPRALAPGRDGLELDLEAPAGGALLAQRAARCREPRGGRALSRLGHAQRLREGVEAGRSGRRHRCAAAGELGDEALAFGLRPRDAPRRAAPRAARSACGSPPAGRPGSAPSGPARHAAHVRARHAQTNPLPASSRLLGTPQALVDRRPASRQPGDRLALLREALVDGGQLAGKQPATGLGHLALDAPQGLGGVGLTAQRSELQACLTLEVVSPLEVAPDLSQLDLGALAAALEAPQAGGLLRPARAVRGAWRRAASRPFPGR